MKEKQSKALIDSIWPRVKRKHLFPEIPVPKIAEAAEGTDIEGHPKEGVGLEMKGKQMTKERLRKGNPYRGLSDAGLFQDLGPGQRTGLFATTAEVNQVYAGRGQRICFCYLNVAHGAGEKEARVVRVETPEWVERRPELLQAALAAVRSDSRLVAYPYVLTRAHELALVRGQEREALEQMMRVEMMRRGLRAEESPKANTKRYTGGR